MRRTRGIGHGPGGVLQGGGPWPRAVMKLQSLESRGLRLHLWIAFPTLPPPLPHAFRPPTLCTRAGWIISGAFCGDLRDWGWVCD